MCDLEFFFEAMMEEIRNGKGFEKEPSIFKLAKARAEVIRGLPGFGKLHYRFPNLKLGSPEEIETPHIESRQTAKNAQIGVGWLLRRLKNARIMAVVGIALQLGFGVAAYAGSAVVGVAKVAVSTTTHAALEGTTMSGTRAASANGASSCGAGASCAAIDTQAPLATRCSFGRDLTDGDCIALHQTAAPGCSTPPETTQSLPCGVGQAGSVILSRSGACNAATGYTWSMSPWGITSDTCRLLPGYTPPPAIPPATGVAPPAACVPTGSWSLGWGAGCAATSTASVASGSAITVVNTKASYAGNATYSCRNGALALASSTCTYQIRPPPPPSPSQSWTMAYIGQGSRGHAFPGTGGDHTPDYAGVEATVRSDGSILVVGIQGGWTGMSCIAPRPYLNNSTSCSVGSRGANDTNFSATISPGLSVSVSGSVSTSTSSN